MQSPETGIENLRGFGYTRDEARFLYLVATHSGYFSTRQYLAFTRAKSGEKSMAFTQKVLGKGHATARLLFRNGRVYHLFARLIYRAIGRENLRNRHEHSVEHIHTKLAILDFVLAHLDYRYLETESETLCARWNIENASDVFLAFHRTAWPRRFRSRLATIREMSDCVNEVRDYLPQALVYEKGCQRQPSASRGAIFPKNSSRPNRT